MTSVALFLGLDYHDDEAQVCALNEAGDVVLNRKLDNNVVKIQAAVEARGQVRRAAIESCCGAANLADARRDVKLRIRAVATEKRLVARTDDDLLVKKLLTLDGGGLITAVTLRAEIGRFDRFHSGKQLSRFCGLSPRNVVVAAVANRWVRWLFHEAQRPIATSETNAPSKTHATSTNAPPAEAVDLSSGST